MTTRDFIIKWLAYTLALLPVWFVKRKPNNWPHPYVNSSLKTALFSLPEGSCRPRTKPRLPA